MFAALILLSAAATLLYSSNQSWFRAAIDAESASDLTFPLAVFFFRSAIFAVRVAFFFVSLT
jgi:hypothetical protein